VRRSQRVRQILINLLSNAVRHSPPRTQSRSCWRPTPAAPIRCDRRGPGIAASEQAGYSSVSTCNKRRARHRTGAHALRQLAILLGGDLRSSAKLASVQRLRSRSALVRQGVVREDCFTKPLAPTNGTPTFTRGICAFSSWRTTARSPGSSKWASGGGLRGRPRRDGDEAIVLAHVNDYDAILLDLMLPRRTGCRCAELRRKADDAILMLTARDATRTSCGAGRRRRRLPDQAVQVRRAARAAARARPPGRSDPRRAARRWSLELDRLKHQAYVGGRSLDLTPRSSSCSSTS